MSFSAAVLIFLWGMFIQFTPSLHSNGVAGATALSLCIFAGVHIRACFSPPKLCVHDSWWRRYAIDVSDCLLFLLVIAFLQYLFEWFIINYEVSARYAYSHVSPNFQMSEQTMNALLDSKLQEQLCNFVLTKMPIYLVVGCVGGYIRIVRKQARLKEAIGENKL